LTVTDGANVYEIPQSKAIERYISRKTGLQGSSDEEAAQIDAVGELINDIKTKFTAVKGDAEKVEAFFNETFPQLVAYLEKYTIKSGNGWIVGNKISQADVTLYHLVTVWFDASLDVAEKLPAVVNEVVAKVGAVPGIAAWVAGRAARAEVF
jgi:glutathione S-transferase